MIAPVASQRYDCILVGGGLQGGLLALAMKEFHPNARVLMLERGPVLAGNHTWSFHPGDVPAACRSWVDPLVQHRWDGYEVRLGKFRRSVLLQYASIPSEHFASVVGGLFKTNSAHTVAFLERSPEMSVAAGCGGATNDIFSADERRKGSDCADSDCADSEWVLLTDTHVVEIAEDHVVTSCGQSFHSPLIIDCRGPSRLAGKRGCGYQKFFGFELELREDWPLTNPTVMESIADQRDGFRFLYTLPFGRRRVMIEDTRFSDSPELERQDCWDVVDHHLRGQGITGFRIVREESGVLPMPFDAVGKPSDQDQLAGGYAGGWFHAATGYSLPMAVAFAHAVASGPLAGAHGRVEELARDHRWRATYSRFLNRLLFRLVTPKHRYRIFKRFYRVLGDDAIKRFYSHRFGPADAFRIIVGIPPTLTGLRPIRFFRSLLSEGNS